MWVDKLNLVIMLLMALFCLVAVFKVGNDKEGWERLFIKASFLVGLIIWMVVLYPAMVPRESRNSSPTMASTEVGQEEEVEEANGASKPSGATDPEPTYSDPLWPTTSTELLAIPEADRWYNSRKRIGSNGTITGPVASVAYLDDRVMVNIGADYPDSDRAQVVIWAERVSDFEDMLNEIDHGNAWVSVSGEISQYDGVAEVDVNDSSTEWRWWTAVR